VYKQEKQDYDAMKAGVAVPVQVTEPTPGVGDRRSTVGYLLAVNSEI
jgi:hypothetical protein